MNMSWCELAAAKDHAVVLAAAGPGSATQAARMSVHAQRRALLLEAGWNFAPDHRSEAVRTALVVACPSALDQDCQDEAKPGPDHEIPVR